MEGLRGNGNHDGLVNDDVRWQIEPKVRADRVQWRGPNRASSSTSTVWFRSTKCWSSASLRPILSAQGKLGNVTPRHGASDSVVIQTIAKRGLVD